MVLWWTIILSIKIYEKSKLFSTLSLYFFCSYPLSLLLFLIVPLQSCSLFLPLLRSYRLLLFLPLLRSYHLSLLLLLHCLSPVRLLFLPLLRSYRLSLFLPLHCLSPVLLLFPSLLWSCRLSLLLLLHCLSPDLLLFFPLLCLLSVFPLLWLSQVLLSLPWVHLSVLQITCMRVEFQLFIQMINPNNMRHHTWLLYTKRE